MAEHPSEPTPAGTPPPVGRILLVLAVAALVLGAWGIFSRLSARDALAKEADNAAVPTVNTVRPARGPSSEALVLPGNVQAYYEAPIYARTSGYLKDWKVDIGTPVKKGQLLAEIETPEVDQQLSQAQADLATAEANYQLARTTDERWQGLLATESVSKQDADQRAGDAAAKKAALQSAEANVARLRDLESFKRVLAPFDGVVTQRNTDVGALINAGQSPGSALFRVSDTHRLRIYVSVPQPYAGSVTPGLGADLGFTERPGRVDPASRTLQVELQVDNSKGELFPGSYAEVHFKLASNAGSLRLPVNALIFRGTGLQVAAVQDGKLSLHKITQGRDFGKEVEVLSGVGPEEDIVINPPDSAADGDPVRILAPAGKPEPAAPAAPGGAAPARS